MDSRHRSIEFDSRGENVVVLDQRLLPHRVEGFILDSLEKTIFAIRHMVVRGAPLIGVTAAYGMWLAAREVSKGKDFREEMNHAAETLLATRPTAVNLAWGLERQMEVVRNAGSPAEAIDRLLAEAERIEREDVEMCRMIGEHGLKLIRDIAATKGEVNVLTHCNAGRLACVEYGTATAPLYPAHEQGIDLHVWVDETRPRLQGAGLTAFELGEAGIRHTVIPDNAAGHVMMRGMVDLVIVGCDRLTPDGDACNKIGTYTKALAARDNNLPFYVALPSSTIDWNVVRWQDIPIEERSEDEVRTVAGLHDGREVAVRITPENSPVANYAFDVTPARLITGIITERGISPADRSALLRMFGRMSGTRGEEEGRIEF